MNTTYSAQALLNKMVEGGATTEQIGEVTRNLIDNRSSRWMMYGAGAFLIALGGFMKLAEHSRIKALVQAIDAEIALKALRA